MEEFDLQARSLLENAEVQPRARSWKAVSRRLDAAQASTPAVAAGWRWAGLGLAVAAALVAGIFIFHDGTGASPDQVELLAASVQDAVPSPVGQQPSEAMGDVDIVNTYDDAVSGLLADNSSADGVDGSVRRHASRIQDRKGIRETATNSDAEPSEVIGMTGDEKVSDTPVSEGSRDILSGEQPATGAVESEDRPDGSAARMLAMLDLEDRNASGAEPVTVQLGGSLSGNESHFINGTDPRAYMSSGESLHSRSSIEEKSSSAYDIPLSFGAGVRFRLTPRLSLGTGLTYTFLGRSFTGLYTEVKDGIVTRSIEDNVRHKMHYLGIPVDLYFSFIDSKVLDFYGYAGGAMEFCVSNRYFIQDTVFKDPVNTPQFSVGAGLGIQFKLSDHFGLYLDPGVRYYFPCNQPKSVRTDRPVMINLEAGLRVNL